MVPMVNRWCLLKCPCLQSNLVIVFGGSGAKLGHMMFLHLISELQSLGNRVDKVFTTMAYENMVNEMHEGIGMPIEKGHLKIV
ncbi:uncharacterized protein LOC111294808 isoform X3 [Durio zibethinus]|uniref:Uncharacterized protein LOC111294808 isoform X3 n=1 Tax=Durio zibethinus TaxID=66656 RepID=A0A6P5YZP5_DURZI|nr:uncharacterized protein LOC111294808 isoform X3 [Durio zibethinus]